MSKTRKLIDAIYSRNLESVEELLTQGIDPNRLFSNKSVGVLSPLVEAARASTCDIVCALIRSGADVNQKVGADEDTPLTVACFENRYDVVKSLLENGANPNVVARKGVATALTKAVADRKTSRAKLVKLLLQHGANPCFVATALDGDAVCSVLMDACENACLECIDMLIQAGAPINQRLFFGTPLTVAAGQGRPDVVELLLRNNADLSLAVPSDSRLLDLSGKTPLQIAQMKRLKKVVEVIQIAERKLIGS